VVVVGVVVVVVVCPTNGRHQQSTNG
jgi:hypothetical protein